METDRSGSFFNYLAEGCRLCYIGAKMVIFVTGICSRNCFYCPVSYERREKDAVFANERRVVKDEDVIEEALSMDALGASITGGEPLLRLERVLHYIRLLKKKFGKSFHIHLYTALAPGNDVLVSLRDAGLDEIRFHPPPEMWEKIRMTPYRDSIMAARELGLSSGIEIPSIKSDLCGIFSLLEEVDGFLNLNELEFSETNAVELEKRGYVPEDDISMAVLGSRESAGSVKGNKMHFCSSVFKDAVQLRERFKRIAKRMARDFDEITDDGTLLYGVIEGDALCVLNDAGVPENMFEVKEGSIETTGWIASDLAEELKEKGCTVYIIERYPMKNGMVVEREPL
ncbi:7-carboxy-7-deazaguanine synthase [uncultured archaeon]|nr:7-carboxy-7-deazaguanine synthase [uncultured archaeon]